MGFASFTIMAASLGPTFLGYFALAQVYAGILNSLFNVQTWESMIKFGAKDNDKKLLANTVKTNLIIDIIGALVAFVFALLLLPLIATQLEWKTEIVELAFLFSFTIPFTLTTLTIGIPRLYNKFLVIAKIQFVTAALKLGLISFAAYKNFDAKIFVGIYILTEILVNVSLIIYSTRLLQTQESLSWIKAKVTLTKEQFKFLWWTNLRTVVRIPVRQLDIIIINQVIDANTVGVYKVYKEIVSIIERLGEPINQALYPEYTKLLGKERTPETMDVTRKIMLVLLSLSAALLVLFMLISDLLIGTLFGKEYLTLITIFYILVFLNSINLFLTPINSLFVAAGFAKLGFYIVLVNNILYLSIALLGGVHYGIYGIVAAFGAQILFNQGAKIYFLRKHSSGWGSVIR